ncbi:MAG: hypothetical protein IJ920_08845 [Paludibacteraceae bacterium]|nr:hypothetical protein [Paludibacteraceae bacterium]
MKRIFILLSAVVVSLTMTAQMQVWSNGTIIFSHDQSDVDSISFAKPMNVQTNVNASSPSSLAGCVYTSSLAGSGTYNDLYALFFLDETNGYYGINDSGKPGDTPCKLVPFTYEISGNDITITIYNNLRTISGKVIGRNGLVFSSFYKYDSSSSPNPAVFVTLNR